MTNDFSGNNDNVTTTPEGVVYKPLRQQQIVSRLAAKLQQNEDVVRAQIMRFRQAYRREPKNVLEMMKYITKAAPTLLPQKAEDETSADVSAVQKGAGIFVRTGRSEGAKALYYQQPDRTAFIDLVKHEDNMAEASRQWWLTPSAGKQYQRLVKAAMDRNVDAFVATAKEIHSGVFAVRCTVDMICGDGWQAFRASVEAKGLAIGTEGSGHMRPVRAQQPSNRREVVAREGSDYRSTPAPSVVVGMSSGDGVCRAPFNGIVDLAVYSWWRGDIEGGKVFQTFLELERRLKNTVLQDGDLTPLARELTERAYEHGVTKVKLSMQAGSLFDKLQGALEGKLPRWLKVEANTRPQKVGHVVPAHKTAPSEGGDGKAASKARKAARAEKDRALRLRMRGSSGK